MNVIFLDFDGVISTHHDIYDEKLNRVPEEIYRKNVDSRIKILGEICTENDAKVVIESSYKDRIDEETLETDLDWIQFILDTMKKYGIDMIGRTPELSSFKEDYDGIHQIWKEDEILEYLRRHPEIDSYCVIDDDDRKAMHMKSDLDKIRNHLVETKDYLENPEEEGLQEYHKEEVKKILQKKIEKTNIKLR